MEQMTFDTIKRPPVSRRNDPAGSKEAERFINESGVRFSDMEKVLSLIKHYPGYTSRELAEYSSMDRHLIAKRLPDLRGINEAHNGPRRKCRVSGRPALTWLCVE